MNTETRTYISPLVRNMQSDLLSLMHRMESRNILTEWGESDFALAAAAGERLKYYGDMITTSLSVIKDIELGALDAKDREG